MSYPQQFSSLTTLLQDRHISRLSLHQEKSSQDRCGRSCTEKTQHQELHFMLAKLDCSRLAFSKRHLVLHQEMPQSICYCSGKHRVLVLSNSGHCHRLYSGDK